MKLEATKKEMRKNYYRILSVGYCDMQSLLNEQKAFAYSCGVYGWNCDYYDINGILISTGYRPLNSENMKEDYETIKEYENKALKIDELCLPFQEKKEKKLVLIRELLNKLKKPMKF